MVIRFLKNVFNPEPTKRYELRLLCADGPPEVQLFYDHDQAINAGECQVDGRHVIDYEVKPMLPTEALVSVMRRCRGERDSHP